MNQLPAPLSDLLLATLSDRAREAEVYARHGRTCAILALDFTGMTRRSSADGIVYALALCLAAVKAAAPAIDAHQGEIVTMEADTLFALFPTPRHALLAALDMNRALAAFNATRLGSIGDGTRTDPIHPCIGLGHGPVLHIPDHDVFGAEVNCAFVLGEDVAGPGEVLATAPFVTALGGAPPGVGLARATPEREDEAGFAFWVVRDVRG